MFSFALRWCARLAATLVAGLGLTGAVRHPGIRLTLAQLTAMPTHTVTVSFGSAKGTESHTETGVPVATLRD